MPRTKVVPRIRVGWLTAMAFVLGLALNLLMLRLLGGLGRTAPYFALVAWLSLTIGPVALLLPLFDQRFAGQVLYMAAAAVGGVLALFAVTGVPTDAPRVVGGGIHLFLALWLVGLLAAAVGLVVSQACYRLVVQDGTLCPGCGYKLIGLTSHVCPECGRPFTYEELGTKPERLEAGATEVEEESES